MVKTQLDPLYPDVYYHKATENNWVQIRKVFLGGEKGKILSNFLSPGSVEENE